LGRRIRPVGWLAVVRYLPGWLVRVGRVRVTTACLQQTWVVL